MLNPQRCGSPSARPSQDWEEGDGDTLAPELLGGAEPSPANDIFSLGASLYELATGARPGPPWHALLLCPQTRAQHIARACAVRTCCTSNNICMRRRFTLVHDPCDALECRCASGHEAGRQCNMRQPGG